MLFNHLFSSFKYHYNTFWGKLINTLLLITPNKNIIAINVWLRQKGEKTLPYNYGDDINSLIIPYLSCKKIANLNYSFINNYSKINYMCIGSIVDTLTNNYSIIWGSGAIEGKAMPEGVKPLEVRAVRGPLTRDFLINQGIKCPPVYGDPAILMPLIFKSEKTKKYKFGIIPHYEEIELTNVKHFISSHPDDAVLINMKNYTNFQDIINKINECEVVISSSLHGLILSDAYGIPNLWIQLSKRIRGGKFKYLDYYKGCKKDIEEPIDFIEKEIDTGIIEKQIYNYQLPTYDIMSLLKSCPFINTGRLRDFETTINKKEP